MKWLVLFAIALALLIMIFACNDEQNTIVPTEYRLINGEPVDPDDKRWFPVVRIRTGSAGCSGTVIGPKVLVTASHCGNNGNTTTFEYEKTVYRGAFQRSPLYSAKDHDMALVLLEKEWPEVPSTVTDKKPEVDDVVTLLGYGCTRPGGGGGNDGILRIGDTKVTGYSGYDVVSRQTGGAALCFGDSGGPLYLDGSTQSPLLAGINSKGNIKDTNYNCRLDTQASQDFFQRFVDEHSVEICGFNKDCGETVPPDNFTLEGKHAKLQAWLVPDGLLDIDFLKTTAGNLMRYWESEGAKLRP